MNFLIYIISFLEWFTTLSIEIIAIRRFTPIIWTNSISTSIILWVILLALSYWYYIWWKNSTKLDTNKKIIRKINFNLALSSSYYILFTFIFDNFILSTLISKIDNYFISILLSSFLLFFIPIFFASQTIPLLSKIIKWGEAWENMWKLLFFSTIWSFLWSVITSSFLFSTIWVYLTSVLNSFILSLIIIFLSIKIILSKEKIFLSSIVWFFIFCLSLVLIINWEKLDNNVLFKTANSYQNIEIIEKNWKRVFLMNWGFSSWIETDSKESFFWYIKEIKDNILKDEKKDKKILIIWAAWFTLPQELSKNNNISEVDVVDIDWSLKNITEKYFLKEKLDKKIKFINESARFFLNKNNKKYDYIILDIYLWKSMPAETLTKKFFESVKKSWENIFLNLISDKNIDSIFSKKTFNTLKNVFENIYFLPETYESNLNNYLTNIIVTNKKINWFNDYIKNNNLWFYTDDRHSIENDLFLLNNIK